MKYEIRRRSGRRTMDLVLELPKPPEDYVLGERLTIHVDGRPLKVHVEIAIEKPTDVLYVV